MKKVKKTTKFKLKAQNILALILLFTLIASVVYSLIRFIGAPESIPEGEAYQKVKSDYLLMLFQCVMGLIVMMVPSFCTHKLKLFVPGFMTILYYAFLYCSVILGEIFSFYYLVAHWDTMLHAMSAAMLATLGFILVDWLNEDENVKLSISPVFISVFAFSFAMMIGGLWEIYEFSFDTILGLNMQKFKTEFGVELVGREALKDTMVDLIVDAIASFSVAVIGGVTNLSRKMINKRIKSEPVPESSVPSDGTPELSEEENEFSVSQ